MEIGSGAEERMEYVFHFTGKLNQSYVIEDKNGKAVYEAECERITLFRDTPFIFRDMVAGTEERKLVGHTVTSSAGDGFGFGAYLTSSFDIDQAPVWEILKEMGIDCAFSLRGIFSYYTIYRHGKEIGHAQLAGTGAYIPKYKDSKLGQLPANGIFKICCPPTEIPGVFLLCLAITKTDFARNNLS